MLPATADEVLDLSDQIVLPGLVNCHHRRDQSRGGLPPDSCVEDEEEILADCERVVGRYHDTAAGAMTQIALAPWSAFSVSPKLMTQTSGMA